jgi:hypothetical protein
MVDIPRGFPRVDNVSTIRRGAAATGQQMAHERRLGAEEQQKAQGVVQLGSALSQVGNAIAQNQIRLDDKQQREIEKAMRDRVSANTAKAHGALNLAFGTIAAQAIEEKRPLNEGDWAAMRADVAARFGEEEYAEAIKDPDTQQYIENSIASKQSQAMVDGILTELENAKEDATNAFLLAEEMEDVEGMNLALKYERFSSAERGRYSARRDAIQTRHGAETQLDRLREVAHDPATDPVEGAAQMRGILDSIANSANIPAAVKDIVATEGRTLIGDYKRAAADEEAYYEEQRATAQRRARTQIDNEARKGLLTHERVDQLESEHALYGYSDADLRRLHNEVDRVAEARLEFISDNQRVQHSLMSGQMDVSNDMQTSVNNVFENGSGMRNYLNWQELELVDKAATVSIAGTGVVPDFIKHDLEAAIQSDNPEQKARAFEAYSLLEYSAATDKTTREQVPEATRAYWDSVQSLVETQIPLADATRIVDERRAMPRDVANVLDPQYKELTKEDANAEALSDLVDSADSLYLSSAHIGPQVQGLYNTLVREVWYANNGGDLAAAQKTAFKSLQNIVSVSHVNGQAEVMTPSPEAKYNLSTAQVIDDVIRDNQDFFHDSAFAEGETPQVRIQSDPLTLRGMGWQVEWRASEDSMWQPITDARNVPQRWTYDAPTMREQRESQEARTAQLRQWESDFNALGKAEKQAFGSKNPRDEYIKIQQAKQDIAAQERREAYFR